MAEDKYLSVFDIADDKEIAQVVVQENYFYANEKYDTLFNISDY